MLQYVTQPNPLDRKDLCPSTLTRLATSIRLLMFSSTSGGILVTMTNHLGSTPVNSTVELKRFRTKCQSNPKNKKAGVNVQ
jgi:hypothetical protein